MSCVTRFQLLRGTTSQRVAMTPLAGELVYDSSLSEVFVGDGVTPGGVELTASSNITQVCRNVTGSTIPKGRVVYISGASAGFPEISLADNAGEGTSSRTIGVTDQEIPNNDTGLVLLEGILSGVDTSSFSEGDTLWLSTSGGIQNTIPVTPDHSVFIGYCLSVSPSSGTIFIRVQNGYEIGELHDVLITSPQDQDEIVYNSAQSIWVNQRKKEYFESVSKNLKSWDATLNYTGSNLTSIVYTDSISTITKTFNYTGSDLTSIVLSGDTPSGIDLTKTLTYTGGNLTGITYS